MQGEIGTLAGLGVAGGGGEGVEEGGRQELVRQHWL